VNDEQLALPKGVDSVADLGTTYSLTAAAALLGVSVKTVQRMVKRGDLPGSHKAPMDNGKGEQWRVPLSALYAHDTKTKAAAPAPDPVTTELTELRDKVTKLEAELREQRTLADERRTQLEQLHLTFRTALTAGNPGTSSQSRWWKRKTKQTDPGS
jgi:excisionase family DNA binding protein